MTEEEIDLYLKRLRDQLLETDSWRRVIFSKKWLNSIPQQAGVYVFKDDAGLVYVGETGNLKGRMSDLFDTRHHNLRRSIGKKFFSGTPNYSPASSKVKFHSDVEQLVADHICNKLYLSFLQVTLGRKELEMVIEREIEKDKKLNIRSERKLITNRYEYAP